MLKLTGYDTLHTYDDGARSNFGRYWATEPKMSTCYLEVYEYNGIGEYRNIVKVTVQVCKGKHITEASLLSFNGPNTFM